MKVTHREVIGRLAVLHKLIIHLEQEVKAARDIEVKHG